MVEQTTEPVRRRYSKGKKTAASTIARILEIEALICQSSAAWSPRQLRDTLASRDKEYDVDINTVRRNLVLLERLGRLERIEVNPPSYRRPKRHPVFKKDNPVHSKFLPLRLNASIEKNRLTASKERLEVSVSLIPASIERTLDLLMQSTGSDDVEVDLGQAVLTVAPGMTTVLADELLMRYVARLSPRDVHKFKVE